jgi:hypothetical protein
MGGGTVMRACCASDGGWTPIGREGGCIVSVATGQ